MKTEKAPCRACGQRPLFPTEHACEITGEWICTRCLALFLDQEAQLIAQATYEGICERCGHKHAG